MPINKDKILVIDDELMPRYSIKMVLKDRYTVFTAEGGAEGLEFMSQIPPDIVILDIKMPDMDGVSVLKEIKSRYPETEVILLTAHASLESARSAVHLGAFDYLMKPFDKDDLIRVVEKALLRKQTIDLNRSERNGLLDKNVYLEDQISKTREKLMTFYDGTIKALIRTIDAKDHYTFNHSEHVAQISFSIAEILNLPPNIKDKLRQAPIIHDLGKIGIDEIILRKKGLLTFEEFTDIKRHPEIGALIIQPVPFLEDVIPIVLYHHEKFDGTGYPKGLKGEDIPLSARVVAIADAIDAMMHKRPYRDALPMEKVLLELSNGSGIQFDPEIVKLILEEKTFIANFKSDSFLRLE
ncbi:MAG: response regulator [Candidatus Firestonebacteria bacterium]|nr:response regulator [Candidatus Firestonebacteria bacterium]